MANYASNVLFSIDTALQLKNGVNEEIITTNRTLTYKDSTIQILKNTTGGILNVVLPEYKSGVVFWIRCKGSSTTGISIQLPGGAGGVVNLAADEACLVACDGTVWQTVIKA